MKLRNKLILSCAALAAVATTAVSTTYAWYTSNREVTAGTVTAKTASNGDDLLLISRTGVANSWSANADLSDIDVNFVPVYRAANGSYYGWDASNNTTATSTAAGGYIKFDLYFKSGNSSDLAVRFKTFKLVNNTETLPSKSTLSSTGLAGAGASYTVDLLRALTMEMREAKAVEGEADQDAATENAAPNQQVTAYQFNSAAGTDTLAGLSNGYDAHAYYNAVKGLNSYVKATTFNSTIAAANGYYTKDATSYSAATTQPTSETFGNGTYYIRSGSEGSYVYTLATEFAENTTYYTMNAASYTQAATQPTEATFANDTYYVYGPITTTYDGSIAYRTAGADTRTDLFQNNGKVNKTTYACTGWSFTNHTGSGDVDENLITANTTTGVSVLKVTFEIYLDGWDKACFDAVQGQNISLDMVFETVSA